MRVRAGIIVPSRSKDRRLFAKRLTKTMSIGESKKNNTAEADAEDSTPNLGLSEILSLIKSDLDISESSVPAEKTSSEPADSSTPAPSVPAAEPDESTSNGGKEEDAQYRELASAGSWGKLTEICEKKLSESGDADLLAKMWWIKSELSRGAVPPIVLAGPLDALGQALLAKSPEPGIDAEALGSMRRQSADLMLETAERLRGSDLQTSISFFERALKLSPSALDAAAKSLSAEKARIERIPAYDRDKRAERALEKLNEICAGLPKGLVDESGVPGAAEKSLRREPRNSRSFKFGIAAAILMIITLSGYFYFSNRPIASLELADLSLVSPVSGKTAGLPKLEPARGLGELDALLYDMKESSDGAGAAQVVESRPAQKDESKPPKQIAAKNDGADLDKRILPRGSKKKEVVDTKGPVETREMRTALFDEPRRPEREEPKVQLFPDPNPRPADRRGRSEVERYIVLKGTDVLARPALGSRIVDYLPEGSEIYVESELGAWLLLRSKQGRAGYILSNDAQPAADSYRR